MGMGEAVGQALVGRRAALQRRLTGRAEPTAWDEWRAAKPGVDAAVAQLATSTAVPRSWLAADFEPMLGLLRSMAWPPTSESRRAIFLPREDDSPPPSSVMLSATTAADLGLAELWAEAQRLEAALAPGRTPSRSLTVNSHAQYRPHTDQPGATGPASILEEDMERTLIVAMGSYSGGEVVVEGQAWDVRYAPLLHDGVTQKHWTAPFEGERYSLVWSS